MDNNPHVTRHDLFNIGLNAKNVMKIIDPDPADDEVLAVGVIGDQMGCLQLFRIRSSFSTDSLKFTMPAPDSNVSCVDIVKVPDKQPKVLASTTPLGLKCFSMKGKSFFSLELSHLTEPIKHLKFSWPHDLFVCTDYMFYSFTLNPEASSKYSLTMIDTYICSDKITSMELIYDKSMNVHVIISAKDRLIRIISGSNVKFEIETSGIPTCVSMVPNPSSESLFIYGSAPIGKVTMVLIDFSKNSPEIKWEVPEGNTGQQKSPVECLTVSTTGADLFVGRSDGTIDGYTFASILDLDGKQLIDYESSPILKWTFNCGESITSIAAATELVVVSTFPGSVFVLKEKGHNQAEKVRLAKRRESLSQVQALQQTISDLEERLEQEKCRYFEATDGRKGSTTMSALPIFNSTDSFLLLEDGSHLLSLEMEVAIDVVIIQCDIPIDVLDTEKNSAVVSFTKTSNSSEVLATFRCQSSTTSLSVRIRSVEGQSGLLRAYVIFKMNPKSCLLKIYEIKPLSLHKRSHKSSVTTSLENLINVLQIDGNFSLTQSHSWLQSCLPEFPEKLTTNKSDDDFFTFDFISTLDKSGLNCSLKKGMIKFKSENISTISILKDFITRSATNSSIKIDVSTEIKEKSIFGTLRSLFPIVKKLVNEKTTTKLKNAIKTEIMATDSIIGQEMLDELAIQEDEIDKVDIDLSFDRVVGLIVDLFIDYHKLKGRASKSTLSEIRAKIPDLISLLDSTMVDGIPMSEDEFVSKVSEHWGMKVE